MPEFGSPLFKRLAPNDTGAARGHQAGFLVPKELGPYFPALPQGTPQNPTPATGIRAILVVDDVVTDVVDTVYQFQTWGGTRTPERRVTSGLKPLLASARGGDLLLIEPSLDEDGLYRFTLVRRDTPRYQALNTETLGKNWGLLAGYVPPPTQQDVAVQEQELQARITSPFVPFDADAKLTTVTRLARTAAFRRLVRRAYGQRCAMCGGGLVNSNNVSEVEAAHIVSRGARGADDIRNGIALCRSHHWAFDQGMITVGSDLRVRVKPSLLGNSANASLIEINGRKLAEPAGPAYAPDVRALAWHRVHVYNDDETPPPFIST